MHPSDASGARQFAFVRELNRWSPRRRIAEGTDLMADFALSPAAQHWINVVLIWVGFGTLAGLVGLLGTIAFSLRCPVGPFWVVGLGIVGSTLGLLGLSWLMPHQPVNPISPLGFLAAALGAFVLLILYRISSAVVNKNAETPKTP